MTTISPAHQITRLDSPNRFDARRRRGDVRAIVIHDTECAFAAAKATFLTAGGVSAHYVIDADGSVFRFVDEASVAFHVAAWGGSPPLNRHRPAWLPPYNGRYSAVNAATIGIELAGFAAQGFTGAQYSSLGALCRQICARWQIAPQLLCDLPDDEQPNATIVTHGWLQTDRTDPGLHFDWERLRGAMGLPQPGESDPQAPPEPADVVGPAATPVASSAGEAGATTDEDLKRYFEQLGQPVNLSTAIMQRACRAYCGGETRGPALSDEYPAVANSEAVVVRQDFTAGIAEYHPDTGEVFWVEVVLHPESVAHVAGKA